MKLTKKPRAFILILRYEKLVQAFYFDRYDHIKYCLIWTSVAMLGGGRSIQSKPSLKWTAKYQNSVAKTRYINWRKTYLLYENLAIVSQ